MLGAYIRGSKHEQQLTIEAQRQRILAHCKSNGLKPPRIYSENITSRKGLDRPELKKCLADIESGELSGLIVAKLDRLSRGVVEFGLLLDRFARIKATLTILDFGIDTTTPNGRMIAHILVSLAQWERETISARTKEALAVTRSSGTHLGSAPYGYRLLRDPKTRAPTGLEPIEEEQAIVRAIVTWRRSGESLEGIAARLNRDQVPTKIGGEWYGMQVSRVISRACQNE